MDNIPGKEDHLPGNILKKPFLENGIKQEKNDFGSIGYGGPCPPKTETHSYIFTLYALDSEMVLNPGSAYQELQKAMKGHVLEEAKLTGYFSK